MANNNRYNAQQPAQPKSKTFLAVVATVLVFAIAAVALVGVYSKGFADWTKFKLSDNDPVVEVPEGVSEADNLDFKFSNSSKVRLATTATAANAEGFPTKTLTATVLPADAYNKAVDWSVQWENPESVFAIGKKATDYITAVPNEDGSNIVTVTCIKAYIGANIIVRVTTRDGGFTADCTAIFVGIPTSLVINTTGKDSNIDAGWNVPIIGMSTKENYAFDLALTNVFNVVKDITPNYSVELLGIGEFNLTRKITAATPTIEDVVTTTMTGVVDIGASLGRHYKIMSSIMSVTIDSNKLVITNFDNAMSNGVTGFHYRESYNSERTEYSSLDFLSYVDEDKKPYLQIKITETNTGFSQILNVNYSKISKVSIDNPIITF